MTPTPVITESESCDHFKFWIKISFNDYRSRQMFILCWHSGVEGPAVAGRPARRRCDTHSAVTATRCPFAVLQNSRRLAVGVYTEAVAVADNEGLHSKDVDVDVVRREAGQQAMPYPDEVEGRECDGGERYSI